MTLVLIVHPALGLSARVPNSTATVLETRGWHRTTGQVPDGTIDEVAAWVGDDPVRATQAAAAESQRPEPRVTLLDQLDRTRRSSDEVQHPTPPDTGDTDPSSED